MTEDIHRRLAAIVAMDVAGYSRLVRQDEETTLRQLRERRQEVLDPLIDRHQGRLANTAGDSLLIEFPSAVEAVRFAVAAQAALTERNHGLPPDRRIDFRAGINVGDVVTENGDLLGDGVNIAARLEGIADPGGICLSGATRDQIRDHLDLALDDLGPVALKNIDRPVQVFRAAGMGTARRGTALLGMFRPAAIAAALLLAALIGAWAWQARRDFAPADQGQMAFQLPAKPSIAVLPFRALAADADQGFLAVGFSEDILTSLAKLSGLFVISNTTTEKMRAVDIGPAKVAEALGVRYVLTGSLQRFENKVRVSAQLIDAIEGRYVWSDRFDRDLTDLMAVRDEITLQIVANIGAQLELGERDRLRSRETDSLDAWLLQREGYRIVQKLNAEDNAIGRRLLERAIAIDPDFATAYANLSFSYRLDGQMGWVEDRQAASRKAFDLLGKALEIDPSHGPAMASLASWHLVQGDAETAHSLAAQAVPLEPSDYFVHALYGWTLIHTGDLARAIEELELSLRLSPMGPDWVPYKLAEAHMVNGDAQAAADTAKRLLARPPSSRQNENLAHLIHALALDALGREGDARQAIDKARAAFPKRTADAWAAQRPYADPALQAEWTAILKRLGLP